MSSRMQAGEKKKKSKDTAREHIRQLMAQAVEVFAKDKSLADRYVHMARSIAMRFRIMFPRDLKRQFCRHCHSFLRPGVNCTIRTHEGHVVYTCKECSRMSRYPYIREQKAKRKKGNMLPHPTTGTRNP